MEQLVEQLKKYGDKSIDLRSGRHRHRLSAFEPATGTGNQHAAPAPTTGTGTGPSWGGRALTKAEVG